MKSDMIFNGFLLRQFPKQTFVIQWIYRRDSEKEISNVISDKNKKLTLIDESSTKFTYSEDDLEEDLDNIMLELYSVLLQIISRVK